MTGILFGGFVIGTTIFGVVLFLGIASIGLWLITLAMSYWVDSYTGYDEKN